MCNTYNGHANYETWLVSMWIDNDEGLYNQVYDMAMLALNDSYPESTLAHQIQDLIEEMNPLDNADLFTDLLTAALSNVNWYEIAENWIETVKEDLPEELV